MKFFPVGLMVEISATASFAKQVAIANLAAVVHLELSSRTIASL